jgi:hypothetical protein
VPLSIAASGAIGVVLFAPLPSVPSFVSDDHHREEVFVALRLASFTRTSTLHAISLSDTEPRTSDAALSDGR